MKNFETQYSVVGSSALKDNTSTPIIEFPQSEGTELKSEGQGIKGLTTRLLSKPLIHDLIQGTIQGSSVNKAKPWQSVLVGSSFFIFALTCVFFGR